MINFLPDLKSILTAIVSTLLIGTIAKLYIESWIKGRRIRKKITLEKLKEKIIKTTPKSFFTIGYDSFPDFEEIATYLSKCYRYSRHKRKQLKSYKERYLFLIKNGRKAGDAELNDLCYEIRKFFIALIDQKLFKISHF